MWRSGCWYEQSCFLFLFGYDNVAERRPSVCVCVCACVLLKITFFIVVEPKRKSCLFVLFVMF